MACGIQQSTSIDDIGVCNSIGPDSLALQALIISNHCFVLTTVIVDFNDVHILHINWRFTETTLMRLGLLW